MVDVKKRTLKNGLTLLTIDLPHLESVTSLVAVGAGSRYETKKINGISHFLEHMFYKGSRKYPSWEVIAGIIDGIGAVHNAGTTKEWTDFWIKSSSNHLDLSLDILSSMIKEPLFQEEEIEKEKGAVIEELRMFKDDPAQYVQDLYEELQFGDQPLGWDIGGDDKTIKSFTREDLITYIEELYSPKNIVLVLAGNLPENVTALAEKYFSDLPSRGQKRFEPYRAIKQTKPRVGVHFKKTDQAHLILGLEGFDRNSTKQYIARVLGVILGEGFSSRLFIQVREKRGWAYHVGGFHEPFADTGSLRFYAGLKLEKAVEGLEVILAELERIKKEKVTEEELKKAKEIIRGRIALRSESTNYLAEHFGTEFVLDREIETFDEYLKKIDAVTVDDIQEVANDLIKKEKYNLQLIGPLKNKAQFEELLKR